jgi:inorganic triphosphatase YgiF
VRYAALRRAMPVEVELKYRAAGPGPLRVLATTPALGRAMLGDPSAIEELDRYLDTVDERFSASAWACRLRSRAGTTRLSLKGPAEDGTSGALHRRLEIEGPATDDLDPAAWPESEARDLVDSIRRGRPLVERFRLHQLRTERSVTLDGIDLGILTLDVVDIEAHGESLDRLHVVELELRGDAIGTDASRLAEMNGGLAAVDGLQPEDRTKLEHAIARLARP